MQNRNEKDKSNGVDDDIDLGFMQCLANAERNESNSESEDDIIGVEEVENAKCVNSAVDENCSKEDGRLKRKRKNISCGGDEISCSPPK